MQFADEWQVESMSEPVRAGLNSARSSVGGAASAALGPPAHGASASGLGVASNFVGHVVDCESIEGFQVMSQHGESRAELSFASREAEAVPALNERADAEGRARVDISPRVGAARAVFVAE